MTVRLGLIGCGQWGWRYIPAALEAGNARVTHVARVGASLIGNPTVSSYLSDVKVVDDWKGMEVDAYVVASPPESHAGICADLLSRGFPVMVEKPMTLSSAESRLLRPSAPFLVNHIHLFSPAYLELRERFISSTPRSCRVYSRGGGLGPFRSYSALWDYGPHDLSMVLSLGLGRPDSVNAFSVGDGESGLRFDLGLTFGSASASIQVWNSGLPKTRSFEVIGPDFRVVYDDLSPDKLVHNGKAVSLNPEKPLTLAVKAFADSVLTGRQDWRFGPELSVDIAEILETAGTIRS